MMNHSPAGQPARARPGASSQAMRDLRACEDRLKHLQRPQSSRGAQRPYDKRDREAQLRREMDRALRCANSCVRLGVLRQADAASLAGLTNSFSWMRRFPVTRGADAILTLLQQELPARLEDGTLSRWYPGHLAMVANGLAKGEGPYVHKGLRCLAQALATIPHLATDQGWTARHLAMMVGGLAKGEGPEIQAALAQLAQAVIDQGSDLERGWNHQDLAMVINGLGKGKGPVVEQALVCLARVFLKGWERPA